jgi:hypothetical protein
VAGGWLARRRAGGIELSGDGAALDALRALCGVAWDMPGVDTAEDAAVRVMPDGAARTAIVALGLDPS